MSKRKRSSKKAKYVNHSISDEFFDAILVNQEEVCSVSSKSSDQQIHINSDLFTEHDHQNLSITLQSTQNPDDSSTYSSCSNGNQLIINVARYQLNKHNLYKARKNKRIDNDIKEQTSLPNKTEAVDLTVSTLDSFNGNESCFVFKLIALYLPINSAMRFYNFYRNHSDILTEDDDLWLWRNLYQRDFGRIKFKKKKGKKLNRQQQLIEFNEKRSHWKYWKDKYQYEQDKQWKVRYYHNTATQQQQLTMISKGTNNENKTRLNLYTLIMFSPQRCRPQQLLSPHILKCSNLYEVHDRYINPKVITKKKKGKIEPAITKWENLNVKCIKNDYAVPQFSFCYGYIWWYRYRKVPCWMVEILEEQRQCVLVECYSNKTINAWIVDEIYDIAKMKELMLQQSEENQRLKVLVYDITINNKNAVNVVIEPC